MRSSSGRPSSRDPGGNFRGQRCPGRDRQGLEHRSSGRAGRRARIRVAHCSTFPAPRHPSHHRAGQRARGGVAPGRSAMAVCSQRVHRAGPPGHSAALVQLVDLLENKPTRPAPRTVFAIPQDGEMLRRQDGNVRFEEADVFDAARLCSIASDASGVWLGSHRAVELRAFAAETARRSAARHRLMTSSGSIGPRKGL